MAFFKVWEDKHEPFIVTAADMNDALDIAAINFGYVDYSDMAQAKAWREDEGLNIVAIPHITKDEEASICEWCNCIEADVDANGDVWVDRLDGGHWLSDDQKVQYLTWRGQQ